MIDIWPDGGPHLPGRPERPNWGAMMVDATLWHPVVRDIAAAVGLQAADELLAGFPGSSAVFLVGHQAVIKLFPPFFASDFQVERTVYEHLQGRIRRIPTLIASGAYHDRIDWPFLVLSYCPGVAIRDVFSQLERRERVSVARQAGRLLRDVHATPLAGLPLFRSWPDFLAERSAQCVRELREQTPLPAPRIDDIAALLKELLLDLARVPGVLLNADLTDDHVLLVQKDAGWALSAVIDWADAEVAHPSYEWIAAWFGFCRRDRAMFRALVTACSPEQRFDDAFRLELLALTFLHRFGALIISESWQVQPPARLTFAGLQEWLWPW